MLARTRILTILALGFACLCVVYASVFATAQVLSAPAEDYLATADESLPSAAKQRELLSYLDKALQLEPQNSQYWQLRGDLLLRSPPDSREDFAAGLAAYQQALHAEPARAIFWAKAAMAKGSRGEFDPEFYRYYQQALAWGPKDYRVNWALAEMGLTWWSAINVDTRLVVKDSFLLLHEVNSALVLVMANRHRQFHMACLWASDLPRQHPWCIKHLSADQ